MRDILFRTEDYVFSYRVAAICMENGKVLLQKPANDEGFAFPGGHVALGETNAETLVREFQEEIGTEISVGDLRWVGEIFFSWGKTPCHQVCLYYDATLTDLRTPRTGVFPAKEHLEGQDIRLTFHWIPVESLETIRLYPADAAQLLRMPKGNVQHFIYREP